eukprot:487850-Pelagomonas_calceolata.AAC.6
MQLSVANACPVPTFPPLCRAQGNLSSFMGSHLTNSSPGEGKVHLLSQKADVQPEESLDLEGPSTLTSPGNVKLGLPCSNYWKMWGAFLVSASHFVPRLFFSIAASSAANNAAGLQLSKQRLFVVIHKVRAWVSGCVPELAPLCCNPKRKERKGLHAVPAFKAA